MARHALLIGVSEFSDQRLARLNAPINDVTALQRILRDRSRGNFDSAELRLNEDFVAVRDHLSSFFHDRSPDDVLLLYYSGHGILGRGNRLFLATKDSNLDTPRTRSVSAQEIRDFIEESRAQHHIAIFDCCHSGAFAEHAKAAAPPPAVTSETFSGGDAGLYVLTAADALQFAWDGAELRAGNEAANNFSQFTSWLVDGLEKGEAAPDDERITMDALYRYLYRRARSAGAASTPQRFVQGGVGDLVISRNPLGGVIQVDPATRTALEGEDWRIRLGAVSELAQLIRESITTAARPARLLLEQRLTRERDYAVRTAITAALQEAGTTGKSTVEQDHHLRSSAARESSVETELRRRVEEPPPVAGFPQTQNVDARTSAGSPANRSPRVAELLPTAHCVAGGGDDAAASDPGQTDGAPLQPRRRGFSRRPALMTLIAVGVMAVGGAITQGLFAPAPPLRDTPSSRPSTPSAGVSPVTDYHPSTGSDLPKNTSKDAGNMQDIKGPLTPPIVSATGTNQERGLRPGSAETAASRPMLADAQAILQITKNDIVLGNPHAPITIVEYASMTCPHCAHFANDVLPELKKEWIDTGKAKLVLRDFPLDEPAVRAAMIAHCAPPDRYYAFADVLFATQEKWASNPDYRDALARIVELGGMSKYEFDACLKDTALENKVVESHLIASKELKVNSTPTFFVNGGKVTGATTVEEFDKLLSSLAAKP
jgi:protein-disulfide isomerase/uncharacterized caspase-like protein